MALYGRFCNYTVHTFSDLCLHIRINTSQVSVPKRVLQKHPNSNAVSLSYLMVRAPERLDLQQVAIRGAHRRLFTYRRCTTSNSQAIVSAIMVRKG